MTKRAKKKNDASINGFTTRGLIQLSVKLSWHIQAPDNKISPSRIGHIYWLLRFADGKYRQATVATIVLLSSFRGFLRKKWLAAAQANWKTNLRESRGIPGRDFRCPWLTPCLRNRWVVTLFYLFQNDNIHDWTQYMSYHMPFCQIIAIYTHFDPITQWNRATNIFISLLIHLLLLFATIRHNSPLFVTIRHYSSLFVTIRHHSSPFVTIRHYSPLFATVCTIRSPFVTIRGYLHYSVTIRHYSRLFALFGHYSSLFATICTIRVILQVQQCFCRVKG